MIRVILRGRTGNNFFQYASARYLSLKHGVPLVLDASWMSARDYQQSLELKRLPIAAKIQRGPSFPARCLRGATGLHWLEWKYKQVWKEPEEDHSFNPAVLELGPDSLLVGYFQSWKYFNDIRPVLLTELDLNSLPWAAASRDLRDELTDQESVAVHVRRTDYLDHTLTQVCGETYQTRAMDQLRDRLKDPVFYIFSDDLDWCRQKFTAPDCRVVDLPEAKNDPFSDLRMMSLAKHNIIVNSSYSWWSAWLNQNPHQSVITPNAWGIGGAKAPIHEKALPNWTPIPG